MAKKKVKKKSRRVVKKRPRLKNAVLKDVGPSFGHVEIGPLHALMYKRDGVLYKHVFTTNKPSLYTNRSGNQMFIKGGRYIWTPLGVK